MMESKPLSQDHHTLRSDDITAIIAPDGAELISLKNQRGLELLWQAAPAWPRHAPILFPIIGRLKNGMGSGAGIN
jgi:galactose mutarotase-like enzyme